MKNYELDYNFKNFFIDYSYLEETIITKKDLELLNIILSIMILKTEIINYCLNSKDNDCSKTFMALDSDIPNNFHDKYNLNKLKQINLQIQETNNEEKLTILNESKQKILKNIKTTKLERKKFIAKWYSIISKQRLKIEQINSLIKKFNHLNQTDTNHNSEKQLHQLQQLLNSITNSKQYSKSNTTLENWFWNKKVTNELNYKYITKHNQKTIINTP